MQTNYWAVYNYALKIPVINSTIALDLAFRITLRITMYRCCVHNEVCGFGTYLCGARERLCRYVSEITFNTDRGRMVSPVKRHAHESLHPAVLKYVFLRRFRFKGHVERERFRRHTTLHLRKGCVAKRVTPFHAG